VIDKHNIAAEPRKGTLAVSAMFLTVVAASIVYWRRFLKFSVVGIVGIDERSAIHQGLYVYISLAVFITCIMGMIRINDMYTVYVSVDSSHRKQTYL
jgi:hypothetical protein